MPPPPPVVWPAAVDGSVSSADSGIEGGCGGDGLIAASSAVVVIIGAERDSTGTPSSDVAVPALAVRGCVARERTREAQVSRAERRGRKGGGSHSSHLHRRERRIGIGRVNEGVDRDRAGSDDESNIRRSDGWEHSSEVGPEGCGVK